MGGYALLRVGLIRADADRPWDRVEVLLRVTAPSGRART